MYKKLLLILVLFFTNIQAKELEKVSLQLNWKYQYEFAGFIAAKELGFYEEMGLDVELKEFTFGTSVIDEVLNHKSNYGIYNSNILLSYLSGKPLKLISSFFKRSALVIITKPNIKTPQDLIGKTIMASGKEDFDFNFKYMFNQENLNTNDFNYIPHTYNVDDFIAGKCDAMTAFISDQPFKLDEKGVKYNIINPNSYGMYNLQLELFTSKSEDLQNHERIKRFNQASIKGWEYALENIDEVVDIIDKKYNRGLSKKSLKYEAKIIKQLIIPQVYQIGSADKSFLNRQISIFKQRNTLNSNLNLDDYLFNDELSVILDTNEKEFIQKKLSIKVCASNDRKPLEYIQNHTLKGVSSGIKQLLEEKINTPFELIETKNLKESKHFLKIKKCDLIFNLRKDEVNQQDILHSDIYHSSKLVFVTKKGQRYIHSLKQVEDKTLLIRNYSTLIDRVNKKYPKIKIKTKQTFRHILEILGEDDFTIISLAKFSYLKHKYDLQDLQISGYSNLNCSLAIGLRNDDKMLRTVINKTLNTIPSDSIDMVYQKWTNQNYNKLIDYSLMWQVLFISLTILIISILFIVILQNNNKLLNKLLNSTLIAVVVFKNNKLTKVNDAFLDMYGYKSAKELLGKDIFEFVSKENCKFFEKQLSFVTEPYELTMLKKDKSDFPTLTKSILITKNIRVVSIMDLSELKGTYIKLEKLNTLLEAKIAFEASKNKQQQYLMLHQSRLAQMGEMVSMIAHQWRQPLSAISATSTALELKATLKKLDDETLIEKLHDISKYSQFLSLTIDDFRNFFKPDKLKSFISFDEVVESTLSIIETSIKNKNITLNKNLNSPEQFETYPNELKQVLLNLIKNAEEVLLEKEIENATINIATNDTSIIIQDNAGGIPTKFLDKIFDPYFSTKTEKNGTGLGLYMSKTIIEDHCGGKLSATNTSVGAIFKVEILK